MELHPTESRWALTLPSLYHSVFHHLFSSVLLHTVHSFEVPPEVTGDPDNYFWIGMPDIMRKTPVRGSGWT